MSVWCGWNRVPPNPSVEGLSRSTSDLTSLGNRSVANVIRQDEVTLQWGGYLANMADVLIESGNLDMETCKQEGWQVNINKPRNTKIASKAAKVVGGGLERSPAQPSEGTNPGSQTPGLQAGRINPCGLGSPSGPLLMQPWGRIQHECPWWFLYNVCTTFNLPTPWALASHSLQV